MVEIFIAHNPILNEKKNYQDSLWKRRGRNCADQYLFFWCKEKILYQKSIHIRKLNDLDITHSKFYQVHLQHKSANRTPDPSMSPFSLLTHQIAPWLLNIDIYQLQ